MEWVDRSGRSPHSLPWRNSEYGLSRYVVNMRGIVTDRAGTVARSRRISAI